MKLADGIRKHGFRKWYERELLQSHAHLVLTFCCMVGLFAVFEGMSRRRDWAEQAQDLATIVLCAVVGVWALRRYLYFLNHAEATANQADCPQCQTYGRFSVETVDPGHHTLQVCCRKCGQRWVISD